MDEMITRAIVSINTLIESTSNSLPDSDRSKLVSTSNILDQLFQSDSTNNKWIRLIRQRLTRLMEFTDLSSSSFWIAMHDDILYALKGSNDKRGASSSWERFLERMEFEEKLEKRRLQFQQKKREKKTLNQLFCEHKNFFEEYLHKCISLHSKLQVRGLVEDLDDFLHTNFGLTEGSFTSNTRKCLEEKLKCIEIPLDCSNKSVENVQYQFFEHLNSDKRVTNNPSNFLPSTEQRIYHGHSTTFEEVLQSNRCIVILGDPGSAKTTLLRWTMRASAETANRSDEEVILAERYCSPVRIPILIRIGEFAEWLEQYQNKTLIDYIGKHTWFSKHYTRDNTGCLLKESIYHGHALILLDGLDEIPEVGRRGEIVDLVRRFIDEYVCASDFVSAFDDNIFNSTLYGVVETQKPRESDGNQIIITSRTVGYQLYPLDGPFVQHYSLTLMHHTEAKKLLNNLMTQVEKSLLDLLSTEGIKIDEETVEIFSKRRNNAMQSMFQKSSGLLMSNPSLLSLLCKIIFQSPDEFHPKCRIEVYNHAVQSALRSWTTQEPIISEDLLTNFLVNLSTYLHLESPSGLIDTYDMKQLCYLTLQQQGVSKDRAKLREYANKLIITLESNTGIVSEVGLQVFGFQHLSFQEYFVSQCLVRGSSLEEIAKRILSFTINPRFRESILLTLEWISWKWSQNDYDRLCNLLVTLTDDYSILLGTPLVFDTFNNVQTLPSKSVIFAALNSLLDHPCDMFAETCLISSLSKLHEDVIVEWMHLHLKDEKRLSKFCQCLLGAFYDPSDTTPAPSKPIPSVIYQQLSSFQNLSTSGELIIDETLRKIMMAKNAPINIFNKELCSYLLSPNIDASNIHPLILSVIIAVCGGLDARNISFSPKRMHRESSITLPIMEYFANNEEPHLAKIPPLIRQYENVLQNSVPTDTSVYIVDTFIALTCLKGLSQPFIYQKYDNYQALPIALDRLKRAWFYSSEFYHYRSGRGEYNGDLIESKVESIMNMILSQFSQSDEQCLVLYLACTAALDKHDIELSSDSFTSNIFRNNNIGRYLECQPEFSHSDNEKKINQMANNIHPMQLYQHEPYFLLTFVPQSLQNLYYCLIIDSNNNSNSLPLVVLLSQCLILLEDVDRNDPNFYLALSMLQPQFKECLLENYASVLFWKVNFKFMGGYNKQHQEAFFRVVKDHILLDHSFIDQPKDVEMLINVERQRIYDMRKIPQNQEKDSRLFAASISLARLFQAQYHSLDNQAIELISLSTVESVEVHFAVVNIVDPILRIIAWSIILDMRDPLIFDEEQRDSLRWEMISLLQFSLPSLPLSLATLLFVRCYSARQFFSVPFQQMADVIGKKLNETEINRRSQDHEAAFIALHQLNDSHLSHHLSEFAKRTKNLSDLLQFSSSIFFRYFTDATSFDTDNTIILSTMYLNELAFDTHCLIMYISDACKNKISLSTELNQLWNDLSESRKIMTYKVATWITNYLKMLNKEEIQQIIKDLPHCVTIERRALSVVENWLTYRMDKDLRFFSYYAALQLTIEGSNIPYLFDIIIEMFDIDTKYVFKYLVERLFNARLIDLAKFRQIMISLHRNVIYSSKISACIDRKDSFEMILNLELERTTSNIDGSFGFSIRPYLLMINGCSIDLQLYLVNHLRTFTNEHSGVQNSIKEEYVAVLVKWIIESSIWNDARGVFSINFYENIFILLHDQRFPQVQKAILNGLNSVFIRGFTISSEHVFLQDNAISHLEKVIHLYHIYSGDVLADCLVAYGNCLLKLQKCQISRNLSNEMQHSLTNLFHTSLSEIISIRTAFCLIFAQQSPVTLNKITSWFKTMWSLTSEIKYRIFLQQTLFQWTNDSFDNDVKNLVDHLQIYSAEILDIFTGELYNYLSKNDNENYLSDPSPDYIHIALKFIKKNSSMFVSAVRRSCFGEHKFKRELYLYLFHTNKTQDCNAVVELYSAFGLFTVELIAMLKYTNGYSGLTISECLKNMKQVSDREVVEKLFEELNLIVFKTRFKLFSEILEVLVNLAQAHLVSLLEVHQRVSPIINNLSYDYNMSDGYRKDDIFRPLLNLSCIDHHHFDKDRRPKLIEIDIDKKFEKRIEYLRNKSSLFLRRNFFFSFFRSIPSNSADDEDCSIRL